MDGEMDERMLGGEMDGWMDEYEYRFWSVRMQLLGLLIFDWLFFFFT